MNRRLTAVAVAGTLGLGTVGAVTLAYPALANTSAPTPSQSPAPGTPAPGTPAPGAPSPGATPPAAPNPQEFQQRRLAAIKEQLKSLVADGTLTQAQADKVAAKLAAAAPDGGLKHGFGGPGRGPGGLGGALGVALPQLEEAAAKALGISADDLRTQLRAGSSIADIAKKQNKSTDSVVSAIVQSARQQLAQAVKDKKLTQAQADKIDANLKTGVQAFVENGRMSFHFRGGPGGGWGGGPGGQGKGDQPAPGTPPAPAPSSSGTSGSTSFFPSA